MSETVFAWLKRVFWDLPDQQGGAMSDVATESTTAETPQPQPPDPRIAELEAENATLKEQLAAAQAAATTTTATPTASSSTPDWGARVDELKTQGLSDEDAVQQAAYEERLWNDQHAPAA